MINGVSYRTLWRTITTHTKLISIKHNALGIAKGCPLAASRAGDLSSAVLASMLLWLL